MLLHTPDFGDKSSLKILNSQNEKLRNQSHSPLQQYLGINIQQQIYLRRQKNCTQNIIRH